VVSTSYEAAYLEPTNPGSLSPVVTGSSQVKREKVGALEVEYQASAGNAADIIALATPVITTVEGVLWPFLMPVLPGVLVI
jgi:fatty acid/phospholipid biosynthesis enzyme